MCTRYFWPTHMSIEMKAKLPEDDDLLYNDSIVI